jgi:SulP family sulfate permease
LQIAGPTGAFIVILSGITATHGYAGLQVATLLAGLILLLLGLARLGSIIKFIPEPVIAGFTAGIGIIIWVGQWPHFLGLPVPAGAHFHTQFWQLLHALPQLHLPTTLLALATLSVVIFNEHIPVLRRVPGPLLAMLAAGFVQFYLPIEGVATLGSVFGEIPRGLPALQWPEITATRVITLIGPAFAIAMLGAIESLLSAVVADGMSGNHHDSNQELIGQGIANVLTPLFGGFAATGAIARTATSIRHGASSPLAGIAHVATLVIVIMLAAPLAVHIPLAALAAILFVVAWNLSDVPHCLNMIKRAPLADVVILLVTFALTVLVDLVVAVNIGVILATLHFLRRMAASVEVSAMNEVDLHTELTKLGMTSLPADVLVFSMDGPFFFAAAATFKRALAFTHTVPKIVIIRLDRVPFIDMTGIHTLESVIRDLQRRQVRVMLAGANPRLSVKLRKAGILDLVGQDGVFADFSGAIVQAL